MNKVLEQNIKDLDFLEFVSKQKYISDIPFIFGRNIYEFDIKQANIHALLAANLLSVEEFNYLSNIPKQLREIEIGNRIKQDKNIYTIMQNVICSAKYFFCKQNGIQESQILRIANDSLYLVLPYNNIDPIIEVNDVPIEFVMKNHFQNYMRLKKELLFFDNFDNGFWNVDVKGVGSDKVSLHQEFLSILCDIIEARNNGGKEIALTLFNKKYNEYITYSLPIDTYRELNSGSMFKIKTNGTEDYYIGFINKFSVNKEDIDISFNRDILRTVYSYLIQS